jgi:hypothetical protein
MLKLNFDDNLAQKFCDEYADNVYNKLQKNINSSFKQNNKTIKLSQKDKKLLIKLFTKDYIEKIILAKPNELKNIIQKLSKYKDLHIKKTKLYKTIYNAFVDNGYNKIDKFKFIKDLDLKSCPYCNRSYIFTVNQNRNLKPEIDHFYPKSIYPYLAISFYNLIPSCPTCNGFGAKGSQDSFKDDLKNPYEITYDDFKFTFDLNSINIIDNKIDEDSVKIKLKNKIDINDDYFQIENLYQEHKDIVIELYQKAKLEYSSDYFTSLRKSLNLHFTQDEVYRLITCGYLKDNDLHKRPLSKFIKDISKELEIV